MKIQIFDVEHGGCALITLETGAHILADSGHNSTTGWRPSRYLPSVGIDHVDILFVTNNDEDHVSDLANLRRAVTITNLFRNGTVNSDNLLHLKELGGYGAGIESLCDMLRGYNDPPRYPNLGDLSFETFYNAYPDDFEDENNLSLVVIFTYHGLCIAFPGDMEVAGWQKLLENPQFAAAISKVNVLVASHHGRENGCCEELYTVAGMRPEVTIISDSGIEYATQETIAWYRHRTSGFMLNGEHRRVLTTRRDGRIQIDAASGGSFISVQQ